LVSANWLVGITDMSYYAHSVFFFFETVSFCVA
jgi:hypothetical protein